MFFPEVRVDGDLLFCRASLWRRLILLFSVDEKIEVNRETRIIRVFSRTFWFLNTCRNISYSRINDIATEASTTRFKGTERTTYSIYLVLDKPRERFELISFADSILVHYSIPITATDAFHEYFDLLSKWLGRY